MHTFFVCDVSDLRQWMSSINPQSLAILSSSREDDEKNKDAKLFYHSGGEKKETTSPDFHIAMRGNQYSRRGDPMMTQSQRRNEKKRKLAKTGRVKRLKNRLKGIRNRSDKREGNHHMTALMESYVTRRKAERRVKKEQEAKEATASAEQQEPTTSSSSGAATGTTKSSVNHHPREALKKHDGKPGNPAGTNTTRLSKGNALPLSRRAPVSRGLY